jgi:putative phosphoesterase
VSADHGVGADQAGSSVIALISDVHGNLPALQAVLEDIRAREVEAVYCLGDLVGYGPDPNGVIDLIRSEDVPTVMGNYDEGVGWETGDCGCYYASPEAKVAGESSYLFTVQEVTAENKAFLRDLPRDLRARHGGMEVHLVHGSPRKINEYLLRGRDERTFCRILAKEDSDVLAFGHTHEPWADTIGGLYFVNVGSVGRPKDGNPRAAYTLLRLPELKAETVRVAYDHKAVAETVRAVGLPDSLVESFRTGR